MTALLSFHVAGTAQAQQSSVELKWCYAGNCTHESLADAERAMDAAHPHYAGKFAGEDTGIVIAGANLLHRATRSYRVPETEPATENAAVYMPAFSSNPAPQFCAASGDPIYPNACRTEEAFVQGYVDSYRQLYGANRVQHEVALQYVSPFSEVVGQGTPPPGQPPRGFQRYNHDNNTSLQRKVTVTVFNESGVPIPGAGGSTTTLKFSSFTCPAGYVARSGAHPDYAPNATVRLTGPVCVPTIDVQTITGPGLQYCSKPTNRHPCYPATGDKARFETDFEFSGRPFVRAYHALRQTGQKPEFAPGWTHSYSDRIMGSVGASRLVLIGESGYYEMFNRSGRTMRYISPGDATRVIDVVAENNRNVFRLTGSDGLLRFFNDAGRLLRVENTGSGWNVALTYDGDRLISATDHAGQQLQFDYLDGRLVALRLPGGQRVEYAYDANRNFQSVRYADGNVRSYHYNEAGHSDANDPHALTGISDNGVRYATFAYDAKGRARLSQLHANGAPVERTTLVYNGDNAVTVTGDRGQTTTYALSSASQYRRITGITTSSGATTNGYTGGKVSETRDPAGNITRYEYSADGAFVNARFEAYGTSVERVTRTTRNSLYQITSTELQQKSGSSYVAKRRREWTYDGAGAVRTHRLIDPATGASRTVTYERCDWGQVAPTGPCPVARLVTAIDGPRTDVLDKTTYAYYNWDDPTCMVGGCSFLVGKLKRATNALGHTVEYTVSDRSFGRPVRVRDANGVFTDFEYDDRGRMTARKLRGADDNTQTDDQILRIEYTPAGNVGKLTLPDGSFTVYSYDGAHRLTAIADAEGNRIDVALDSAGAPVQEQIRDSQGTLMYSVSRSYTALGELQSVTDAYNRTTTTSFDANGNPDRTTDPLGRVADQNVDPLDRLTRVLQDMNGIAAETKFGYDALDNLTQVNDPKGLNTNYVHNGLGDLVQLQSPDTGTTTYVYDSAGNRIAQTDARGVTTTYTWDALNRPTAIVSPTPALDIAYTYDTTQAACAAGETFNIGRLTRIDDASGSTAFCHDRYGNVVRKVQTTHGRTFVLRHQFNVAGQLTAIVYPDGTVVDYVHDSRGHVVEVGVTPTGGARQVVLGSATWYPFGPVAQWTYGNGRVMKRGHNRNYQPGFVEVTGAGGLNLGYEFDAVGNLIKLRSADQAEPPQRGYVHDGLNRLTQAKDGTTDTVLQAYAYDQTGNRTSATVGGTTTAYSTGSTSHRLNAVGTTTRSYDAAGNTTQIGANKSFVYDDLGRLRQTLEAGVPIRDYAYNGLGQQVRRWAANDDRTSLYGDGGEWLGEYDTTGAPLQQIVWFNGLPVAVLTGSGAAQKLHYIEADALGTPRVVVDPTRGTNGTALWRWNLTGEAFGNTPPNEDPDGDGIAFVFDMRFPGQRFDAASGLNYNYFRDYDPSTGRYIESDPIGLMGGISTYAYANSGPLGAIDPLGLKWTKQQCGAYRAAIMLKFAKLLKEFRKYDPIADGKGGFPMRGGGLTKPGGHYTEITELQAGLKNDLTLYAANCRKDNDDGNPPIHRDVDEACNRQIEKPVKHEPEDENNIADWEYWEEVTGLTGTALVLYLLVSEGSRLFPPRNLVPVP